MESEQTKKSPTMLNLNFNYPEKKEKKMVLMNPVSTLLFVSVGGGGIKESDGHRFSYGCYWLGCLPEKHGFSSVHGKAGELGAWSLELAGGALAIGFTNITGYSVLSGLAMAMEPLCSQAFGSRNLSITVLILRRTILMLLFASLPIGLLWINLKPMMLCLHQDPEVVDIASLYCQFAVPDLMANSLLHPIRIYLCSKGTTWPLLWCTSLSTLLHYPITIFLTFHLHLGIQRIAISNSLANFNTLFFLVSYILYLKTPSKPLSEPLAPKSSSNSLGEDWGMLLRLSLPSCLAVCLEWWWYQIMTPLAGYLERPHVALATSAIVIQSTSLTYTLPSALSAAISTRVGNELGAGRPHKARLATFVAVGLAFLASIFGFLLTTIGREAWGRVFTKDTEVLELTLVALPIIGLCEIANCPQTTCCGVLRGTARPSTAAGINFYSFNLMGTPVAIGFCLGTRVFGPLLWSFSSSGSMHGLYLDSNKQDRLGKRVPLPKIAYLDVPKLFSFNPTL